jgi:hypothetical protein
MRQWDGIEDDNTDVLEGENVMNTVENCSYFVNGELGRRPGFGAQIVNTGLVAAEIGAYVIFIKSNGNIESEAQ